MLMQRNGSDIEAKVSGFDAKVSICSTMQYLCIGFEATLKRKSANAGLVQRIWCECHHMRCRGSGFEVTLKRKSANSVTVQRI